MGMTQFIIFAFIFFQLLSPIYTLPLAPALYVFRDSFLDTGNNNVLPTFAKANYLPYGVDFQKGATGRFTNGRNVSDFIAEFLGLPYPPPYMSLRYSESLAGLNYASGSCGILPETGKIYGKCLNLKEQINLFQRTVERTLPIKLRNSNQLSEHLSKSIYLFSIGSNDHINNYIKNIFFDTSNGYTPQSFAQLLIGKLSQQFERLYNLGARKVIMFEIGPIGFIPSISRKHKHTGKCLEETNHLVSYFNLRLPAMLKNLTSSLPGSIFVLGHVNLLGCNAIKNPSNYGFVGLMDASNPCCTTWDNGTSECIPLSKPCQNPNKHFFWDAFHQTETVYSMIATRCFNDTSICTPVNIQKLVKCECVNA